MTQRPPLPDWAETVRRKYLSNEASVFILHLNVFNNILYDDEYYSLPEFIGRVMLWDNKSNILTYDPAAGVSFLKEKDKNARTRKPLRAGSSPSPNGPYADER